MLSPSNDESTDNNRSNGTSSMTLPEYNNGWETYSLSDDATNQSDSRPSTMDELIGSPGLSPISHDTDTDDNGNFDQDTVISLNDTAIRVVENPSAEERGDQSSEESSADPPGSEKDSQISLTEPSGTESAATVDTVEFRHLKKTVKKLRRELDLEKDTVMQLRRKITLTNKDKLSQTSQFNDEMSLLKYENVALQAKLEEQSVHTEQLEYEITKVRKQMKQDKIYADQREQQDAKQLEDLKSRLTETHGKLAALEESHSTMKRENAEEIHRLKVEVSDKESVMSRSGKDTEIARKENQKLGDFIKEQESTLKDMLQKIQTTELQVSAVNSQLAASNEELTNQRTVNSEQLGQLQELQEKHKTLSNELAQERSLADEQRSSIELLEARSVQLEVALNDEKSVSGELRSALERLRSEHNQLEVTHNQQCRDQSDAMHSLTRSEQELITLKKQIQMEKDDKRDVVGKLKKQLDVHQEHMKRLREGLAVANKHQVYMEEISQKIVNDLQPLFNGFPSETGETNADVSSVSAKTASQDRTRNVLDTLYNTVARYKRRLTSLTEEQKKSKALCDSLTKEMKSYKDMLYDKEKAYDDCKDKLADVLRERNRIARESTEFEARSATLTVDVETSKAHNQTLQSQCHSLRQEITQLKGKYERDVDEKLLYLQHIHHLLTSDLDTSRGQLLGSAGKLSWSELSTTVTERLAAVLTELCSLRSQVMRLEETNHKSECSMESLREEHASKMDGISQQLSAAIERSSMQWKAERAQLDDHYSNMVNEHQHRQQIYKEQLEKSQRNAEEAWGKLRDSDEANRCLEAEQLEIHENIALLEKRQKSLVCALALVAGCYFPLVKRVGELKEQRVLLTHQLDRFAAFKAHVGGLLQTLASDSAPNSPKSGASSARLLFRKLVIVVLATRRLQSVGRRSVLCVTGEDNSLGMCWPALKSGEQVKSDAAVLSEDWLVSWLTQVDLESAATSCTKDIFTALDRPSESSAFTKRGYLQSVVSSSTSKLLRQLSLLYTEETTTSWPSYGYSRRSGSLSTQLTHGLHNSLSKVCESDRLSLTPAQSVATRLQERVLSFVQQLHVSEAERQRLKQSAAALEDARQQLQHYQEACSDLESELHSSRKQAERLVSADKLQEVMSQLEQALDKERNAQALLAEQSSQMKELTRRLEVEMSDRDHMEQSAKFSFKTVNEELEGKLALVSNLSRQVATLEGERRSLHDNLYDAEHALKTAANDRQALFNYAETLATAFNKCTGDGSNADLNRVMLSGELIPTGCTAPGLLSVQRLAQGFVDSYTALQVKVSALNTVTTEQLQEINRLKQEMSLVCTGQSGYAQQSQQVYQYPSSGYGSSLSPLKISSDFSPVRRSPAVLDVGLMKLSASHSPHRMSSSKGAPSPRLQMNGNMRR